MPPIINSWYLHIYYSFLWSNEIPCGTKSHQETKTLCDEWTVHPPHFDLAPAAVCGFEWAVFLSVQLQLIAK